MSTYKMAFAVAIVSLSVAASAQSLDTARPAIEQLVRTNSRGQLKLVSLDKINFSTQTQNNVSLYHITYNATVEFLEDAWWSPTSVHIFQTSSENNMAWPNARLNHKGDTVVMPGRTLQFVKMPGRDWQLTPAFD